MTYPHVHCIESGEVCQVTTGFSEINAASTISALVLSDKFDLTKTYFMVGGIAGVNPRHGTLGSAALAKYLVRLSSLLATGPRRHQRFMSRSRC